MDENLRLIRTKSVEKVCVPPRASEPLWFLRQPFQDSSTSSRPRPSEWRLVADYPSSNTLARCWLAPATTRNANRSASCFLPGYYSREQITPPWRGGVTQVRPIVASIGLFCSTASPMMTILQAYFCTNLITRVNYAAIDIYINQWTILRCLWILSNYKINNDNKQFVTVSLSSQQSDESQIQWRN